MTAPSPQSGREILRDLVILTVLIGALFSFMLGNRPLSVPDEGRYVEIPREMVQTGDYVTPRLNGVKYFEKPVLFYWLETVPIRLFGIREFTLRLWPALFALAGCLGIYGAGRRLYGRKAGFLGALVLATSLLYYALSRAIILDMTVTVLLTGALLLFLIGTHEPDGPRRRLLLWGFYACSALAVLAKGLIGIFIPAMIIGCWILLLGKWRLIKSLYLPSGIALFLLIAAPWHILVSRANPEFPYFYFIHEHFLRYLTKIHSRYQPDWFFIPIIILGLFPWTAFLAQAVQFSSPASWRERHEHSDSLFLILWAVLIFLFFSASDSKLIPYILPVLPPLALLVGRYLAAAWDSPKLPGVRAGFTGLSLGMIALAVAAVVLPSVRPTPDVLRFGRIALVAAGILASTALAAWLLERTYGIRRALPAAALGWVLLLVVLNASAGLVEQQSSKPLALMLKPQLQPGDEVASYGMYYQDLPVYLGQRITVVDWTGELDFGCSVENTKAWMIDSATFWKQWNGPGTVYMFTKRQMYDALLARGIKNLHLIAGTEETVLATNKEKSK